MIKVQIEDTIKKNCPELCIATIECRIQNSQYSPELWEDIKRYSDYFISQYQLADIKDIPTIKATREAYKKLGKDPNRYRPSSEALCRRLLKGMSIYQINTAVDLINLISIKSGYSIGGFDKELIKGNLTLGIGEKNESFSAIGRGLLNIENLPVYRDETGGIGTPTSDEERTKIRNTTTHLFMIINAYSGNEGLLEYLEYSKTLLSKYLFNGKYCDFEINLY